MAIRRALFIPLLLLLPVAAILACSEMTRYRVLSFLLDGVPEPGASRPTPGRVDTEAHAPARVPEPSGSPAEAVPPAAGREAYAHPPYRDYKCSGCHTTLSGQPFRSVEDGLCQACHRDIPGQAVFVHGPVAVNACLFCHHHHAAPFPKLLVSDPATLCFRCHNQEDLTAGEHHPDVHRDYERQSCIECHDPHRGSDRFFLRRPDS